MTPCEEIASATGPFTPFVSGASVIFPPGPMLAICSVENICAVVVTAARKFPVGSTANCVRKGENIAEEPTTGASVPDAALNALTSPETLSAMKISLAVGGGGCRYGDPYPDPQAIAKTAASVAARIAAIAATFDLNRYLCASPWFTPCFQCVSLSSQRICLFSFCAVTLSISQSGSNIRLFTVANCFLKNSQERTCYSFAFSSTTSQRNTPASP